MTQYLYTREKSEKFELFGELKGHAYNSHEQFPRACISYLEADGEHKLSTCLTSDLYYYILSGEGEFAVGGERFKVKATDAVLVPKNTEYGYFGKMNYVLFMTPSFTPECEIRSDRSPRK
jgi:hypothetical protein